MENKYKKIEKNLEELKKNVSKVEKLSHKTFLEIASILNSSLSIEEIKVTTIEILKNLFESEAASLLFFNEKTWWLYFDVALWEKWDQIKRINLPKWYWIAWRVAENKQAIIVKNVRTDPRFFSKIDKKTGFQTRNMMCAPIFSKWKFLGVIQIINKQQGNYTEEELKILIWFTHNIWMAIENAIAFEEKQKMYNQLEKSTLSTVYTLVETVWQKDNYTAWHTRRVKEYSLSIWKILWLWKNEIKVLVRSARLHDVGKIWIPDKILQKTWKLTDKEYEIMKSHAIKSARMLKHLQFLEKEIPIVQSHHERFDWRWYPHWLKWEEIPFLARIITVADAFDAMTTTRSYRKALSKEYAIQEIIKNKWTQFDPEIADTFVNFIKGKDLKDFDYKENFMIR